MLQIPREIEPAAAEASCHVPPTRYEAPVHADGESGAPRLCSEVVDLLQDSTGALQMLEGSGWFDQTEDCKEEGSNFTK